MIILLIFNINILRHHLPSLKYLYEKIYLTWAVGSFALYAVLVALFTAPVIEAVKKLVS